MARQQAVKDDESKFWRPRVNRRNSCCTCSKPTRINRRSPKRAAFSRNLSEDQQHRGIEAFETRQDAPIRVVHDALRIFIGTRPRNMRITTSSCGRARLRPKPGR